LGSGIWLLTGTQEEYAIGCIERSYEDVFKEIKCGLKFPGSGNLAVLTKSESERHMQLVHGLNALAFDLPVDSLFTLKGKQLVFRKGEFLTLCAEFSRRRSLSFRMTNPCEKRFDGETFSGQGPLVNLLICLAP